LMRQHHTTVTETPEDFIRRLKESNVPRVPGTALFLTRLAATIPFLMVEHLAQMRALYETVIGLTVKFKAVSAQNFINFFTDPKARVGIDGFPTVNYPDYADPAAFYNTVVMPDGSQNYDAYDDPQTTKAMNAARSTADPAQRAKLVAQAGDRIMQQLPWIPMAAINTVLITSSKLTGAPASFAYMGGPWANLMGSTGAGS